jgi:hypothetical protein
MSTRALLLAAVLTASAIVTVAGPVSAATSGGGFTATTPSRVLDTRDGTGVVQNGPYLFLDVSQYVAVTKPTAVVLNLTGVDAKADSYVTVWAHGGPKPDTSNLNVSRGQTAANLTTVLAGLGTQFDIYVHGDMDLVVDIAGFYQTNWGSGFTMQTPKRVLDTRDGAGPVGPNGTNVLDLSSVLPPTASAVSFNLTGTDPTSSTYVAAWPDGQARPAASALNLVPGQTRANMVTVPVPADRKINLYNHSGTVDLIADLAGYYSTDSTTFFYGVQPTRFLDTRTSGSRVYSAPRNTYVGADVPLTASGVVVNLTATNATEPTNVVAWPAGEDRPGVSNLNLGPGETVANMAMVGLHPDQERSGGEFSVATHSGSVDVIGDLAGYFAA